MLICIYYFKIDEKHMVYYAMGEYGESPSYTPIGKSPLLSFSLYILRCVFYLQWSSFCRNSNVAIKNKLFRPCIDAPIVTLSMDANRPHYRDSATRAIQSSALYLGHRFLIYDTPLWQLAYDMIGFFEGHCFAVNRGKLIPQLGLYGF